jgi:hypothetical protein
LTAIEPTATVVAVPPPTPWLDQAAIAEWVFARKK